MPLASFETPAVSATTHALDEGPNLECAPPGHESGDQPLCIRATRHYPVSREDLFATWTRRTAWDSWMRLRARSRATLAPCRGGAFRLELAEGPTIQVITGVVNDLRPHEFLSLHWVHHNTGDQGSVVDVSFYQRRDGTQLSLVHRGIGSRREASWLMRLWSTVLGRLGNYVAECAPMSTRRLTEVATEIPQSSEPEVHHARMRSTFARSAGLAIAMATFAFHDAPAQVAPDSARAASHYSAGRWSEAAQAYGALARTDTSSIMNWYRYGVSLEELGQYTDAVSALRHALRAPAPLVNQVHYRLAKAYAGAGIRDSVFAQLDTAAASGFRLWETVRDDADFAPFRSDARFTRALAQLENNRFPCRQRPPNRQLDYWVGDWNVMSGSTQVGTNKVELVNGDCIVLENWLSAGGGGGKSWSYYDPSSQQWKQVFIFDAGGTWEFTGGLRDGAMRFERPLPATGNTPAGVQRMTYFPIARDSVRQYIESSTDGGKTWTAGFDGMYVRKPGGTR